MVVAAIGGTLFVRSLLDPENVRHTLERQASDTLGQPVAIGKAELAFWPRAGVTLTDVTVGAPAALTLKRTAVSTAMRSLLSRRIEDADVVVEDSALDLPRLLATLDQMTRTAGGVPGSSSDSPSADAGVTLVNVRTLSLRNVRITAGARTATFDVQCTNGTTYNVALNEGSTTGGTIATRLMTDGSASPETVSYQMFRDSARTLNWGKTIATDTVAGTGNGAAQTLTVYGRIPPQTTPSPNTYTDLVTVTITY